MIYVWFISIWQIFHIVFFVVLKLQLCTDCIKSNKHLYAENVYCKYGVPCCTHIRSLINFVIWKCFSGIVCMLCICTKLFSNDIKLYSNKKTFVKFIFFKCIQKRLPHFQNLKIYSGNALFNFLNELFLVQFIPRNNPK